MASYVGTQNTLANNRQGVENIFYTYVPRKVRARQETSGAEERDFPRVSAMRVCENTALVFLSRTRLAGRVYTVSYHVDERSAASDA